MDPNKVKYTVTHSGRVEIDTDELVYNEAEQKTPIPMPATPAEREKHRKIGELMIADKARWLVTQRAVREWQRPPSPAEAALNAFFVVVAIAGGAVTLYFIGHQVAVWAR